MSEETSELELEANERMTARIADLERQLTEERARIDCSINNGWLSGDLECAGEDGPACWKHLLAEAQGKLEWVKRWTRGEGSKSELYRALSKEENNATPRSN